MNNYVEKNGVEINMEYVKLVDVQMRKGIFDEIIGELEKKVKRQELLNNAKRVLLSILGLKKKNQVNITDKQLLDLYKEWLKLFERYTNNNNSFFFFSENVRKILNFNRVLYNFLLQRLGIPYAQHYLYYSEILMRKLEKEN